MKSRKKSKHNHEISRQTAIFFAIISMFMALVFSSNFTINRPIDKTDAEEKTAVYNHYEAEYGIRPNKYSINTLNYIVLFFENGEKEFIRGTCINKELYQALESLKKDTVLQMLINPDNGYVIELKTDEKEILDFDYVQKKLQQDAIGFLCLSVFMLMLCGYFIYKAIRTKERLTKADIKFYLDIMRGK